MVKVYCWPCQMKSNSFQLFFFFLILARITQYLPKFTSESRSVLSNSLRTHGLYSPWNSLGQNTGVGSLSLLQGIFPTQGSNPGLLHCRRILYQLSHKGSPRILERVAYHFSSRSLQPRNWTWVLLLFLLHWRWIIYQLSYSPGLLLLVTKLPLLVLFQGRLSDTTCDIEIWWHRRQSR